MPSTAGHLPQKAFPKLPIQATLLTLCAAGCYLTWGLFVSNGSIALMEHIRDVGPHVLTGTNAPIKQRYTGIRSLDNQLGVLTVFFWELVDGSLPHASLHAVRFGMQVMVAWGLVMVEGMRAGNKGLIISYVMIWGLLIQNATYAVVAPILLTLSLATSKTESLTTAAVITDAYEVASIPASLVLGFAVPAAMLALPAPSMQSFEAKQTWMAVWQGFPIWVAAFQQIVKRYMSFMLLKPDQPPPERNMKPLSRVYLFLFVVAAGSHLAAMTLMVTSTLFPSILPAGYAGAFNLFKVMVPSAITAGTTMSDVGSGALMLLQYDEIVGSTAVLLWASFLYLQAHKRFHGTGIWLETAGVLALLTTLAGPVGCAVFLMSARDQMVFAQKNEKKDI